MVQNLGMAGDKLIAEVAEQARDAGVLGIDTEFMSEGRYRPLLCLIQLAVPNGDSSRVELIDPFDRPAGKPLADVLADPDVEIVMHAARQDVAILRRVLRTEVRGLFDTQLAAGFAGLSASLGYGALLDQLLGVKLKKGEGFTKWDRRPLTPQQLRYAQDDVVHLIQLADAIKERLEENGRLEWVREECRPLEEATDERDVHEVWRRLPRVNQLSGEARAVAREVAGWRERVAQKEDKPPSTIVADQAVVAISRTAPRHVDKLRDIRGLYPKAIKRWGHEIVAAVKQGAKAEPPAKEGGGGFSTAADAPLIALCEALVRARALEAGLAYELIASRADLTRVVVAARLGRPEPEVRTLQGWRRAVVGEELDGLLRGDLSLAVGEGRRLRVTG
ncbi:MAG: ribonuclease D [Thermoleophilaceae bacterium]